MTIKSNNQKKYLNMSLLNKRTRESQTKITDTMKPAKVPSKEVSKEFIYTHTNAFVNPKEIRVKVIASPTVEVIFQDHVKVIFAGVQHSGFQPFKTFPNNNTQKQNLTVYFAPFSNKAAEVLTLINDIYDAAARHLVDLLGELGVSSGVTPQDGTWTDQVGVQRLTMTLMNSPLQIVHRHARNKPNFIPLEVAKNDYANILRASKEADVIEEISNGVCTDVEDGEKIFFTPNILRYIAGMEKLISEGFQEPEGFSGSYFPDDLINVECALLGGKVYVNKEGASIAKPNYLLTKIRVIMDGEKKNQDNAKWCVAFRRRGESTDELSFSENNM